MRTKGSFLRQWALSMYFWAAELLYHPFAWMYDFVAWLVSFGYWSRWRIDALYYLGEGNILEVGFGTGELLIEMTSRGLDVTGVELSPQMHRVVSRKLQRLRLSARRVRGQAGAMPFPSACFDNIIATFPSNYIMQEQTLQEVHRVLTVNGRLVIVGMGVAFKHSLPRRLMGWVFPGGYEDWLALFSTQAACFCLKARVMVHETQAYALPVVILEQDHDQ